jgi:hypothetical protein
MMQWISVDERLPEPRTPVLAAAMFPKGAITFAAMRESETMWFDLESVDSDGDYNDVYGVTHWMPYPDPPAPEVQP